MRHRLPSDQQIERAREGTESLRVGRFNRSQGQGPSAVLPGAETLTSDQTPKISGPPPELSQSKDLCTHCGATNLDEHGEPVHIAGCSVVKARLDSFRIRLMASSIRSVAQLRRIILDAEPRLRNRVYELIAPHITRFKPPPLARLLGGPRAR